MTASDPLPRVLTSRDGSDGIQLVTVIHNTADRSARFEFRIRPDQAIVPFAVYAQDGIEPASLLSNFQFPVIQSAFLTLATVYVWEQFDDACVKGEDWRPGSTDSLAMDTRFLLHLLRARSSSAKLPSAIVEDAVRLSTPFGVPAVIDPLLAAFVGKPVEQLRRAVLDLKGHSWDGVEDRTASRFELDATSAFRAAHGLLASYDLLAQLTAPRYAGVASYWRKAIALRVSAPPDAANAITNAAHAVEAMARLAVNDSENTAGAALDALAASGRVPSEVAKIARQLHGRTSGDIGARHGHPSGPLNDPLVADYYLDVFAATLRQLLLADAQNPPELRKRHSGELRS